MITRARTRIGGLAALTIATAMALVGCSSDDSVVVGSANFPESKLIAEIYADVLEGTGAPVERRFDIGAREIYMKTVEDGSVAVVPEYSGALLTYYDKESGLSESQAVYDAIPAVLPDGLEILDKSAAEDKDGIAVTEATAATGITTLADLKDKNYVLGGPGEFETRVNGVPGLEKTYGVTFAKYESLQTGPLTEQALNSGQVQAAVVFTTQSEIVTNNWVVLEDPQNLFIAQNVLPLVRSDALTDDQKAALNAVSAVLTTDDLKQMMKEITVDQADVATVAQAYVEDKNLG